MNFVAYSYISKHIYQGKMTKSEQGGWGRMRNRPKQHETCLVGFHLNNASFVFFFFSYLIQKTDTNVISISSVDQSVCVMELGCWSLCPSRVQYVCRADVSLSICGEVYFALCVDFSVIWGVRYNFMGDTDEADVCLKGSVFLSLSVSLNRRRMRMRANNSVQPRVAQPLHHCDRPCHFSLSFPSLLLLHSLPPSLPLPVVREGCEVHSCLIYQPPSLHSPVQSLATQTDTAPRPTPYPHLLSFYSKEAESINYRLNCHMSSGYAGVF